MPTPPRIPPLPSAFFSMLGLLGLLDPVPAPSTTWVVTTLEDEIDGDTLCSLREATEAARTNQAVGACLAGSAASVDTIFVLANGTLELESGRLFLGGGDLEIFGPPATELVISGGFESGIFRCDSDDSFTLTDLTLVGGSESAGGAVECAINGASLTLERMRFEWNEATAGSGGAVALLQGGSHLVADSVFSSNFASNSGGALYLGATTQITIRNSRFENNTADGFGGALATGSTGSVSIEDSEFLANSVVGSSRVGGAISSGSDLIVRRSTLAGNRVHSLGGFSGGGALAIQAGRTALVNTTIVGNKGPSGGGILVYSVGTVELYNVTLARNEADAAAQLFANTGAVVEIGHSLFAEGAATNCFFATPPLSLGYNIGDDDSCGLTGTGDRPSTDPLLGGLGHWGGPTATLLPSISGPVVDTGWAGGCVDEDGFLLTIDQRGGTRPIDGDDDGLSRCDPGAVEVDAAWSGLFLDGFESGDAAAWDS